MVSSVVLNGTSSDELLTAVHSVHLRRMDAFMAADKLTPVPTTPERLQLMADATTVDDLDILAQARASLDERARTILDVYVEVQRDYGRFRCSVCGMTRAQADAVGNDCTYDC